MGTGAFLKLLARNLDVIAGNLVTLAYPLYASVKAIESPSPADDRQWLTYWVLHSLLALFELTFAKVIKWLPFWPFAKLIIGCWLVLPHFKGAAYVYQHYLRPFLINNKTVNIWYVPRKKDIFGRHDDVLLAAKKFIGENGPEKFDKHKSKVNSASKFNKGSKRVTFGETEAKKESKTWKSIRPFKFGEGEAKKEMKSRKSNAHVTFDNVKAEGEVEIEKEAGSWATNSSFTIFDDDRRYWN